MKETRHITIQIAGQQAFELDIPADRVKWAQSVERNVNKIWAKWCEDFKFKSPQDILAMVAFQFARFYYDLLDKQNASENAIRDFEQKLDNILLDVK